MRPRELFSSALTRPAHLNDDLHYIGEALPAPSQVNDVTDTSSSLGNSSIPAREDHAHAVDLTNYYTKAEADALHDDIVAGVLDLSGYYTAAEVDALLGDYYTAAEIDILLASTVSLRAEYFWPGLVNDDTAIFPYWVAPSAGEFTSLLCYWRGTETNLQIDTYVNDVLADTGLGVITKGTAKTLSSTTFAAGDRIHLVITALTSFTGYDLSVFLDL